VKTENIERYLNSFGKQVVKRAKSNLKAGGKGGGNLEKSIKFEVVEDESGVAVQFFMADYGTFQDKGVKGTGGEIKSGDHKGKWSGRRHYTTWEGKRKDSPYKYGSGSGKKGGMSKGIGSFIKRKGLQPRSEGGQYMSPKGLKIAIMKVLWIKGIHGISFFQESLNYGLKKFGKEMLGAVKEDIINSITTIK
tara:strand:- start:2536 stop:3111 length:576 start_codon:yes stop_codon:yes gene_type:complete